MYGNCVSVPLPGPLPLSRLQPQAGSKGKAKKVDTSFSIDCTVPVEDEIMEVAPLVSLCGCVRVCVCLVVCLSCVYIDIVYTIQF